ncbi:MAG: PQQ-binding-like beta-propeller repeat protein [Alphaproteobacteria bacterium]|nr:PQQ-binding-like beta-propeller repeat protein [Alphaproteobacteria bacterium]
MLSDAFGRRAARLVLVFAFALVAASCASNTPVGKVVSGALDKNKKDQNIPKEEDRISILALDQTIEPDPRLAGVTVELPPPYVNPSWPQPGGEADHTLHSLAGADTFKVAWKTDIGKGGERAVLTAPPVAADGRIFVTDAKADVSSYDMHTGKRIWETVLTPKIRQKFRLRDVLSRTKPAEIGFGGGVALDSGKLFVTSGFGFVVALDAETGKEIWRYKTDAPIRTPPTATNGYVYFVTITNQFVALNEDTGEKAWEFSSFEEAARILSSASPAAVGDFVVAPFSSGEIVAVTSDTGRSVWSDTLARNTRLTSLAALNDIAGSPIIDRGFVFAVSHAGLFAAIDIRTGQRVWEAPIASVEMPWVAGDYIFVVSVDGELVCLTREEGAVVWVSKLRRYENEKKHKKRIAWAGPVLVGGNLVLVSTRGDIVKVSPQDGSVVETKRVGDGFSVAPIVADQMIYLLSEKGELIALH